MERWSFSLQDPIFLLFFGFFRGMFELNMLGCKKLQNRNRRFQFAHESLKGASTPSTMLAGPGKPNTCLISSCSKWVIDFGAIYHMTGNSSLFNTFHPHPST